MIARPINTTQSNCVLSRVLQAHNTVLHARLFTACRTCNWVERLLAGGVDVQGFSTPENQMLSVWNST